MLWNQSNRETFGHFHIYLVPSIWRAKQRHLGIWNFLIDTNIIKKLRVDTDENSGVQTVFQLAQVLFSARGV